MTNLFVRQAGPKAWAVLRPYDRGLWYVRTQQGTGVRIVRCVVVQTYATYGEAKGFLEKANVTAHNLDQWHMARKPKRSKGLRRRMKAKAQLMAAATPLAALEA